MDSTQNRLTLPTPAPSAPSRAELKLALFWTRRAYQQALAQFEDARSPENKERCDRALAEYDQAFAATEGRL